MDRHSQLSNKAPRKEVCHYEILGMKRNGLKPANLKFNSQYNNKTETETLENE
jgi:hypothetical protein